MTTDHIGGRAMAYSFEQFCKDANAALRADPGRGGKETIRRNLEVLLKNAEFVDSVCGPQAEYGTRQIRSEEHTSELQSLMRSSYAVFCLKKKKHTKHDKQ